MLVDLENVTKVKNFVSISQSCFSNVSLCSGNYYVDGKSILGIFSLDLSKPITLVCENKKDYSKFKKFEIN